MISPRVPGYLLLLLLGATHARAEIVVDGHLDEPEWKAAAHCGNWQRTVPFGLDAPREKNDLAIVATEAGLAAALTLEQPPSEPRFKPRTPRDAPNFIGDSITLIVDFDGTGQVGYEFSVGLGGGVRDGLVINQNEFDRDWDGEWHQAIFETDEGWTVEILIPWSTVRSRASKADVRTIGVFAARYLESRAETSACPGIVPQASAFVSQFKHLEIKQFDATGRLEVAPYVTAVRDLVHDDASFKSGADVTWKARNFWLGATLNPDFGQVESDELVVNFSAIETVRTDKRPFFTENQDLFDLRTPQLGQLIYTRRIGAASDDGKSAAADIDAALKLTGNAGSFTYGGFVAQEDGYDQDAGRLFAAARVALPLEHSRVGVLSTFVDRPFLDRTALVNAVDGELKPSDAFRLSGQVARSDIALGPTAEATAGYQAWAQADFNAHAPISHTLRTLYIDDQFDMNDLGYLERNSLSQVEWETNRRVASTSPRVNGVAHRLYAYYRENGQGDRLPSRVLLSRDVQYRSAWRAYQDVRLYTSGVDDLLSRGNGSIEIDPRQAFFTDLYSPRFGNWSFYGSAYLFQQGVSGYTRRIGFSSSWLPTEQLTLRLDLQSQVSKDWLLWETGNLFGSYQSDEIDLTFRLDFIPTPKHELRLLWQWIGLNATPNNAYRTDSTGHLRPTPDTLTPFTLSNLGLQVRYRYEFSRGRELFLVYARGGLDFQVDDDRAPDRLFGSWTDLRDADQFLLKLTYGF